MAGRAEGMGDLRGRAARGTIVNAVYLVGLNGLGLLKGFVVAAFLTVHDYGVWGLLVVALMTLMGLVQVGVDDKYIQQDEEDQEHAFQLAFTLQAMLSSVFVVLVLAGLPLFALAFGEWEVLLPGYVIALAMPATALQAPLWAFYRQMDFLRQRKLQAFDPIVSFVVTVGLAAAGMGYWSLAIGMVCGSWAAAFAAMAASPYPLRLRYRRGVIGEYARFSVPLMLSGVAALLIALVPTLVAQRTAGLAAVGIITIAATVSNYAGRVDEIITDTLYPAICAVKDRMDLLRESFLKSNRVALLWAVPLAGGVVLFAPDLVRFVLGERWLPAVFVLQVFAITAALNQVGFNWSAFYRALDDTRPIAVGSAVMLVAVLAVAVPLLVVGGVDAYAVGMGVAVLAYVCVRLHYLARLFGLRPILVNVGRAVLPTVGPVALIAVSRVVLGGAPDAAVAAAEVVTYCVLVVAATVVLERELIREFRGYLKRPAREPARAQTTSATIAAP